MASGDLGPQGGPPSPGAPAGATRADWPAADTRRPADSPPPSDAPPPAPDVPATTGAGWAWVLFGVLGWLVGTVLSAVLLAVVAAANGHSHDLSRLLRLTSQPPWVVVCGLVGLWIGFLGAVVLASKLRGSGHVLVDMHWGFRRWDPVVGAAVGLGGQLVLLPLLYLPVQYFVPHLSEKLDQPAKHLAGGFHGGELALIAFLTVIVVPIVEELTFRGLMLRGFLRGFAGAGRRFGPALAVVATGVVFGLAHAEPLQFLGLMVFGAVLAVLAYRSDRLGPSIFAHGAFNLIAILSVAAHGAAVGGVVR